MAHQIKCDDYIEHPAFSQWDLSSVQGAAQLTLSFRQVQKIQSCHENVHTMALFQHLVSVLIPATVAPLGFSKHSYLFPQDPCRLEYTLQSMICGPWLYRSHRAWLIFIMPRDM